jgi:hypothetical protein
VVLGPLSLRNLLGKNLLMIYRLFLVVVPLLLLKLLGFPFGDLRFKLGLSIYCGKLHGISYPLGLISAGLLFKLLRRLGFALFARVIWRLLLIYFWNAAWLVSFGGILLGPQSLLASLTSLLWIGLLLLFFLLNLLLFRLMMLTNFSCLQPLLWIIFGEQGTL